MFDALNPDQGTTAYNPKSITIGEGWRNFSLIIIRTKELHIGTDQYRYQSLFEGIDGSGGTHSAGLYLMQEKSLI